MVYTVYRIRKYTYMGVNASTPRISAGYGKNSSRMFYRVLGQVLGLNGCMGCICVL